MKGNEESIKTPKYYCKITKTSITEQHTPLSHTLTWLTQTAENVLLGNSNWSSRKSKIFLTLIETQMGVTV